MGGLLPTLLADEHQIINPEVPPPASKINIQYFQSMVQNNFLPKSKPQSINPIKLHLSLDNSWLRNQNQYINSNHQFYLNENPVRIRRDGPLDKKRIYLLFNQRIDRQKASCFQINLNSYNGRIGCKIIVGLILQSQKYKILTIGQNGLLCNSYCYKFPAAQQMDGDIIINSRIKVIISKQKGMIYYCQNNKSVHNSSLIQHLSDAQNQIIPFIQTTRNGTDISLL